MIIRYISIPSGKILPDIQAENIFHLVIFFDILVEIMQFHSHPIFNLGSFSCGFFSVALLILTGCAPKVPPVAIQAPKRTRLNVTEVSVV